MIKHLSSLKFFIRYLKNYIFQEIVLVILMFMGCIGTLVSPYILKIIIDKVFPSKDFQLLIYILLVYVVVCLLRIVLAYFSTYMFENISNKVMKDIRVDFFAHIIKLPLSFFDKNKTGDILHRVNNEVDSIQSILTGSVVRMINGVCTIIGLTVMLCILNPKLLFLSLTIFPLIYINTQHFQPKIHKIIKLGRNKDADILSYLMECFSNVKIIKNFASYKYEEEKLSSHIDEQISLNMKQVYLSSLTRNVSLFLTAVIPILILYVGGRDVIIGVMTVGSLVAFIQYMNRLFDPFRDLMGLYFDLVRAVVSMDRIYEIFSQSTEHELVGQNGNKTFSSDNKEITFKNVSFQYNSIPVLDNVSFTLEPGLRYALVGPSGCGKSTIINLLCKFYVPTQGNIYIGGIDIHDVNLDSLRKEVNLVTQDNHLFHDSVINNILYGIDIKQDQEYIRYITQQSRIDKYIAKMPDEMDTIIGDKGVTLSGGECQRIALSRLFLNHAGIVILDESTSAIDSETEKEILENIYREKKNKTIIIVSHRLSAIKDVDIIICMDRGRIIEIGNHNTLLQKRGTYWNLFKEQI